MELDVHGVRLRFDDAMAADRDLVRRQLPGADAAQPSPAPPDVVVRFVNTLALRGDPRRVGTEIVDDEGLVVTRRSKRGSARARVVVDGEAAASIVCERHALEVPFLVPLLCMAALRKGLLPLHAAAFRYQGRGVAATGWSGAGKTAVLLAMTAAGAAPVATEWALLSADGSELLGVPQPVRVKPSHVARWSALGRPVTAARSPRQRLLAALLRATDHLPGRVASTVEGAVYVDVPVARLPGVAPATTSAPFDVLLLLEDADVERPSVVAIEADAAVERLAAGLEHDLGELRRARRVLRYARGRPVADPLGIDAAAGLQRELLTCHLTSRAVPLLRYRQAVAFDVLRSTVERTLA